MEALCIQDDQIKAFNHVRSGIRKVFSFGKFEGIVGEFTNDVVQRLTDNPLIERITPDIVVSAVDYTVQSDTPAHLVRLTQENAVDKEEDSEYFYDTAHLGQGVNVYIIDTGVFVEHPEFEGRAILGPNFSEDIRHLDYVGHGTHVAGVVASKTYGVAKKARVISIKSLDRFGLGSLSSVIAGLEYAVNHRKQEDVPGVANLSLGAARSSILDSAIEAAVDSGMIVLVAAGNSNMDACRTSPAGSSYSLTVGAIDDKKDRIAGFSNWGRCVDIFSSGVDVISLSNNPFDYSQIRKMSGTSMASPVVAGICAILLEKGISTNAIRGELFKLAIDGAIPRTSLLLRPGSPNMIASTGVRENMLMGRQVINSTIHMKSSATV
ncbi:hypothetical protein FOA43_000400 [Brettanomyces nanus]|uniref:Peptidase S8/S53 domain-containing protein n=1 Tax=Eeniella nana TaxID=13502 RepID=A0A875RYG4_EENNA|nr:uncharacterized protein FOA43_000400 [Brettanomyces nanus]QPG73095.1 hypothetical protein FOA43_000400 [Brettanomyces nanus]